MMPAAYIQLCHATVRITSYYTDNKPFDNLFNKPIILFLVKLKEKMLIFVIGKYQTLNSSTLTVYSENYKSFPL